MSGNDKACYTGALPAPSPTVYAGRAHADARQLSIRESERLREDARQWRWSQTTALPGSSY